MNKYEEAGDKLLREYGITIKTVRKSMSGLAYIGDKVICTPSPKSPLSFAIFAHEVGHIANGKLKPRWYEEMRAWEFSLAQFRWFGFSIPREVRHRMKYSLAFALAKALNRGMGKIPAQLKPYKKYLEPVVYLYGDGHRENKWHADYWKVQHL